MPSAMIICPADLQACARDECLSGFCESTGEIPLHECESCGAVIAAALAFGMCSGCVHAPNRGSDDFKLANVKASQTVDIRAFVAAADVPLQYFETPYFLAPGKRGEKVYALLRETLRKTSRIAIAQVVIRTTQHLAAVVVDGPALTMITLRYANELRSAEGMEFPAED